MHRWSPDLFRQSISWSTVRFVPPPDPPDPPDPPGPGVDSYARIETAPASLEEGQSGTITIKLSRTQLAPVYINLRRTGGTSATDDYEFEDSHGTISAEHVTVEFLPGETLATVEIRALADAGVEATETVEYELDADAASPLAYTVQGEFVRAVVDDMRWGAYQGTIEIEDATVVPPPALPTWSWVTQTPLSLPEESGVNTLQIEFDTPLTAVVQLHFYTVDDTATGGVHYVAIDEVVSFPVGSTGGTLELTILNDQLVNPGAPYEFSVIGEVNPLGVDNCLDPVDPEIVVVIIDDETPPATQVVQFAIAGDSVIEPQTGEPASVVRVRAVVDYPFIIDTDVSATIVATGIATPGGYTLDVPVVAGALNFHFVAGQPFADVFATVNVNAVAANAELLFTLIDGPTWDLGTQTTFTLTVLEGSISLTGTQLSVKRGLKTGRSMVEGILAVNPPSATLPRFKLARDGDTLEDCQVMGHARDSSGLWHAVWVAGMVANDIAGSSAASSFAYELDPILVELGVGAAPAESGSYAAFSIANMFVRSRPCNVAVNFQRALTESLAGVVATSEPQQTEGPSGALFTGVGADLRQTFYFRVWLKATSDATADVDVDAATRDTRCMQVEIWATHRADCNAVIVEWRLANDTYKEGEDLISGDTSWSAGEVHQRFFEFDISLLDPNWEATFDTANPNESYNPGTRIITIMPDGVQSWQFVPTAEVGGRFALYDSTDPNAEDEAIRLMRFDHHFVAAGPLGPTRNECWGDTAAILVDHGRAGYTHPIHGSGWRGVFNLGERQAEIIRGCWANGDSTALDQRYGWMQTEDESTRDAGAVGGKNVHGIDVMALSAGEMEVLYFEMLGALCRVRQSAMDPYTGRIAWEYVLADNFNIVNSPMPFGETHRHNQVLPVMNRLSAITSPSATNNPATWCKAPTNRPWNTPNPDRLGDENYIHVDHDVPGAYQRFDAAHSSRVLRQLEGGWWACRSYLARRGVQSMAAMMTRGFGAHIPDPVRFPVTSSESFAMYASNLRFQQVRHQQALGPSAKGSFWFGQINSSFNPGWAQTIVAQVRAYAWAARWVIAAYIISNDQTRDGIVRVTNVTSNWLANWVNNISTRATPFGSLPVCNAFGSPNAYDPNFYGVTNITTRTGAVPGPIDGNGNSLVGSAGSNGQVPPYNQAHWTWEATFHSDFLAHACRAMMHWAAPAFPVLKPRIEHVLRRTYYMFEAHNAIRGPVQDGKVYPKFICGHVGQRPYVGTPNPTNPTGASNPEPYDQPPTLAQYRAGASYWATHATDSYGKSAMAQAYAFLESDESDRQKYLRPLLAMFGINPAGSVLSQTEIANLSSALYGLYIASLNSLGYQGEHTFLAPYIAVLENLANP